uniref:Uncharacterized protein n=1 Tax=Oryza punctata TaxID=4537 RepID=A0A0E0KEM5_ORYPU
MALNKNVANTCTMLSILLFSQLLLSSHGRPLPDDDDGISFITSAMQIRRYLLSHGNGMVEGAVSPSSEIGGDNGPMVGVSSGVRPTNPGHSPGIGHAVVNADVDDVRPTNPGHSPGIGHAFVNKIDGPAGKKKL